LIGTPKLLQKVRRAANRVFPIIFIKSINMGVIVLTLKPRDRGGVLLCNTHKGEATPYRMISAIIYAIQLISAMPMVPPRIEVIV
jgi:hypothetical protein